MAAASAALPAVPYPVVPSCAARRVVLVQGPAGRARMHALLAPAPPRTLSGRQRSVVAARAGRVPRGGVRRDDAPAVARHALRQRGRRLGVLRMRPPARLTSCGASRGGRAHAAVPGDAGSRAGRPRTW
eukprot:scaffold3422_cov298-Prasinococcus_capsulatus_cf.AAC.4